MPGSKVQQKLAAILVADIVGYSRLMEADEAGTYAALRAVRTEVIDPAIDQHEGRIVKHLGDGFLAEFPTVHAAVECAVDIQREIHRRGVNVPEDQRLQFRIGINLGDIIVDSDGDIFGDGVNVAARLESLASPGGICISGSVYDSVRKKFDVGLEDLGEQAVKNISTKVRAYELRPEGTNGMRPPQRRKRPTRSPLILGVGALMLSLLVAGGVAWWQFASLDGEVKQVERAAVAIEGLEIMFFKRSPYHVQEDSGAVSGVFADRISKVMVQAGITFTWVLKPASWHLQEVQKNDRPMCISGWFKTPDRETYAKFSDVIYRDAPFVVLTRNNNNVVLHHKSVKNLLADTELRFGAKQTFSYGEQFDRMFRDAKTIIVSTPSEMLDMLNMLAEGLYDYTLVDLIESEELSRLSEDLGGQIVSIRMPDMPPSQGRYLVCTQQVDDALIEQIDKAIEAFGFNRE